jgi:lipase
MGPRFLKVNGADLAIWERPGRDPAILLCHATGFHGHCWDAVTDHLGAQRCLAIDLRGHGQSTKPDPPISWREFGNDVADVARQLQLKGAIGVGHSMGGHSITLAAALVPEAFSHLLLLDPVIMSEEVYVGPPAEPHFARRRKNRWSSWQEMLDRFSARPPFDRWDAQVLRDYCEYGLLPAPEGGFVLACPPQIEGSIYEQSQAREANIYPEIARVKIQVTILRAPGRFIPGPNADMNGSPTPPDLASKFANAQDIPVEYSHLIPMEAPEFVADQILRILGTGVPQPQP